MKRRKLPPPPAAKAPDVTPKPATEKEVEAAQAVLEPKPEEPPLKLSELTDDKKVLEATRRIKGKDSRAISMAVRLLLDLTPEEYALAKLKAQSMAEKIAFQIIDKASTGVQDAIKIILERTEGRVPQALELTTNAHKDVHERVSDIAVSRSNEAATLALGGLIPQHPGKLDVSEDESGGAEGD